MRSETLHNPASLRETVLKSLSAVGAVSEAKFYAELFTHQAPEGFALIVLDPRCLKNPLLEALISNLRILSDLGLTPVLLVGALDDDRTSIRFQSQRLMTELEAASVMVTKLNTASYGLIPEIRAKARKGYMTVLEMTERRGTMNLRHLVTEISPGKVIFLQPSGGISVEGRRLAVINVDRLGNDLNFDNLTFGQSRFVSLAAEHLQEGVTRSVYVIASPLNLLAELFTTKGSGTLMRRGAKLKTLRGLRSLNKSELQYSLEESFGRSIRPVFLKSKVHKVIIEEDYRGGAIFTKRADHIYLSKFWVIHSARGEGIARDIWENMCDNIPEFFWRSRRENPFNDWYMRQCDGMQISGNWRVFWKGMKADDIPQALELAVSAPDDFES